MCALQCVCCGHQVKRQEEQTYAPIIALISLQPRGETFRRLCMFLCAAPDVVFRLNLKMSASFLKSRNKQARWLQKSLLKMIRLVGVKALLKHAKYGNKEKMLRLIIL